MDSQNSIKKKSKKNLTCAEAEEQHLLFLSKSSKTTSSTNQAIKSNSKKREYMKTEQTIRSNEIQEQQEDKKHNIEHQNNGYDDNSIKNLISKKKTKPKKNKNGDTDKQNISMKSSFSKFDALQKRSLIHSPQGEVQQNCRLCDKNVYKMEEVKAEKHIYHKHCFRCNECNKQLKVDTYQSHEGVMYCTVHFRLLFAPKLIEDNDAVQPLKPEVIIRENQPAELPPDVARASDKPDLGLEELHKLNVRSKFQAFEQGKVTTTDDQLQDVQRNKNNIVKRSSAILSQVARLQQLGSNGNNQQDFSDSSYSDDEYNVIDFDLTSDNPNADFMRRKKNAQKPELPVGIGEAMNDIRTLFEKGHGLKKDERREERKQELKNIRSRLFMGKQARIKEMYQQAVAESEHAMEKKPYIDIKVDSKYLRERFENGKVFIESLSGNANNGEKCRKPAIEKEADVFESAISKKSRSIFMELDSHEANSQTQRILPFFNNNKSSQHRKVVGNMSTLHKCEVDDIVKCGEATEDVKIQTSEISEKFKFFEKYHPIEKTKSVFRITPPRDGVVRMPPEEEISGEDENFTDNSPDRNMITHSRTTSMMLNKFRELEKNPDSYNYNCPKPLKCFTPPPDSNRLFHAVLDSEEYNSNDDDEDDDDENNLEEGGDDSYPHLPKDDEALKEAQNAARAKQLRIKFEKWEANEIKREEIDEDEQNRNDLSCENSIESTQSIRERFEKMRNIEQLSQTIRPRNQVNRFV